jgi:preprotein translocase subunit SecD
MARRIALGLGVVAVIAVIVFAVYGRSSTRVAGHHLAFELATSDPAIERRAALAAWVDAIRERVDEKGVTEPSVFARADAIIVEVVDFDDDAITELADLLVRRATLALLPVDATAAYTTKLRARVTADQPAGITADIDSWTDPQTGQQSYDAYLRAEDSYVLMPAAEARAIGCTTRPVDTEIRCNRRGRDLIARYVSALADLPVPEDRQLAYEHVDPASQQRPFWRTYLLERTPWLTGTSIARARRTYTPTGEPTVTLELDAGGALRFAELSAANIGRRLAIVVDGIVRSVPVINSPIPDGEIVISMANGPLVRQQVEADELRSAVQAGSMPGVLRLVKLERFEVERDDGIRWNVLAILGLAGVVAAIIAVVRRR